MNQADSRRPRLTAETAKGAKSVSQLIPAVSSMGPDESTDRQRVRRLLAASDNRTVRAILQKPRKSLMSMSTQIKNELGLPAGVVQGYLQDLTDEQLMIRPHADANHIAWQLGHLISSENALNNMVCPDSMPALPEGFAEKHTKETASSDDPGDFCTKDEYLAAMETQRNGTVALLDRLSDEELSQPSPEHLQMLGPTVGAVIAAQSAHWMMHAGQWVIIRRQLGKPAQF